MASLETGTFIVDSSGKVEEEVIFPSRNWLGTQVVTKIFCLTLII